MISCNLNRFKRVLCLGAHSDDIEIGCGGTVLRVVEQSKSIEFYWLVLCSNPTRAAEAKRSANAYLGRGRTKAFVMKSVQHGILPYFSPSVTASLDYLKSVLTPSV